MTKDEVWRRALQLPERERLQLAEELWVSVSEAQGNLDDRPLPLWQRDLLDERLAELERNPEEGTP